MKNLYKIVLFLAIFQITVVMVESLDVFPNTFFATSDVDELDIEQADDMPEAAETIFSNMFLPSQSFFGTARYGVAALVGVFLTVGTAVSFLTKQNPAVIVVAVLGYSFFNMISNGFDFFSNLFMNWDSPSLIYLGIAFGVGLVIIVIITILESLTHGRSG